MLTYTENSPVYGNDSWEVFRLQKHGCENGLMPRKAI